MDLKNKSLRYVFAIFACIAILILYFALALYMQWENGGGFIIMGIVFAAIAATWKGITKVPKEHLNKPSNSDEANSEAK